MRTALFSAPIALLLTSLSIAPARADVLANAPANLGASGGLANSWAYGVSNDGSVVVGESYDNGWNTEHAFRWTVSGGMQDIGTLGTGTGSASYGVSADGSTVVGWSYLAGSSGAYHAFRWTSSGGMQNLGTLGTGTVSLGNSVSADGSTVVGNSYLAGSSGASHAFRWTSSGGMQDLGTLGTGTGSWAWRVSADGSTVVGMSYLAGSSGAYHAFRWTSSGGMADLGTLGTGTISSANSVSADGSTVVGWSYLAGSSGAHHAFRWTTSGGMQDIGTLGTGTGAEAYDVSADGSTVVGWSYLAGSSGAWHAIRWTQATGMADLNTLLANAGVNMTGIELTYANGISSNGKHIVGQGTFPGMTGAEGLAYLVLYDDSYTPPAPPGAAPSAPEPIAGVTSGAAQIASAEDLSGKRGAMLAQSRASANELLGMARPVTNGSYAQAGGMFGSAMGYVAGQASLGNLTAIAGLGYGQQDYGHVEQNNALTFAGALRYTFPSPFGGRFANLRPYAELGGWATPEESLTFSRAYLNGSGTATGQGSADASSFAGYARGGLIWEVSPKDKLVGHGEFGRQCLSVSSYVEAYGPRNPFPAEVNGGMLFLNVARAGGQWTRDVGNVSLPGGQALPVSFTLAGAAAHSFDAHTGLTATLAGAGTVTTASHSETWGEFGARAAAQLTKNLSLGLDVSAIAGADPVGSSVHGGASLTFAF